MPTQRLTIVAFTFLFFCVAPATAGAAIGDWEKGASISPQYNTEFASDAYRQTLQRIKGMNANYVTLIIPFGMGNIYATDFYRTGGTPTDESLAAGIDAAHAAGLKVNLKVQIYPEGEWSIYINPSDRETWFRNYRETILLPLARLAQAHGVEQIVIGSELERMSSDWSNGTNGQNWRNLIAATRAVFPGLLTFNAQHDFPNEKAGISFWDSLDIIGVSGYHNSNLGEDDPSQAQLLSMWQQWGQSDLKPLADRFGKPVMFTEVGFKSANGSHKCPGCWWWGGGYDPGEQMDQYRAIFEAYGNESWFRGIHLWDWKTDVNYGGPGNNDYSPQNKPTESFIRDYFGQGGGNGGAIVPLTGPVPSSSSSSVSVSSSSSAAFVPAGTAFEGAATAPGNVTSGVPVSGTATALNKTSVSVNGVIVDTEIYDGNNQKVYQSFSENQSFAPGESKPYTFSWVPPASGQYRVKVGIFANLWSTLLHWNDEAVNFTVSASSSSVSSVSSSSSSSSSIVSSSSSSSSPSSSSSSSSSSSVSSSPVSSGPTASIEPQNPTVSGGGVVDFIGRNFGREEDVRVMSDGTLITTVHADGGGNFSTGSMRVTGSAGSKVFTFTGTVSGITRSVTVTVQ